MDPIRPGFVGAAFSQSASNKKELKKAAFIEFGV